MQKLVEGARELNIELTTAQVGQFETYYQELTEWNRHTNLTAVTGYEAVQVKHFLDSLSVTLALKLPLREGCHVLDVGTGAGLPGLPLKIAFPHIGLVLLEATAKKAAFLEHVIRCLGLVDVEIITGRAETVAHQPEYRETFDLVLSRGVAELAVLAELTLPFCKTGGVCIAPKKGDISREMEEAAGAVALLGGRLVETKDVALNGLADGRCLVVIDKISPSPERYPRRPGMPAKRPLNR